MQFIYYIHRIDKYPFNKGITKVISERKDRWKIIENGGKIIYKYDLSNNMTYSKINCIDAQLLYLTNKYKFYMHTKDHNFIPETCVMTNGILDKQFSHSGVIFMKNPVSDFCRGTFVFNSIEECKRLSKTHRQIQFIIQPSIPNLLLYEGRKFDIRMFVVITNNKFRLFKYGYAGVCKNKFNQDVVDKKTHLTNMKNNYDNIDFDETFDNYDIILEKMTNIIKILEKSYLNMFNNKYTVILLGVDFIVDQDFNVFILETNYFPYYSEDKYKQLLCYHLVKDVYEPLLINKKLFMDDVWKCGN